MIAGLSIWKLLVILGIIVLIFGTKKLRNLGGDLGGAVKGFKSAMDDEAKSDKQAQTQARIDHSDSSIEGEAAHKDEQNNTRK